MMLAFLLSVSAAFASTPPLFVLVENGLVTPAGNENGIPYGKAGDTVLKGDRLPKNLPIPDYVRVYNYTQDKKVPLLCMARAARSIIDSNLAERCAVLFRNLTRAISSPQDFKEFWNYCCEDGSWTATKYLSYGHERSRLENVVLATNNEMLYNPRPPSRIAFYCLHPAILPVGGETLVVKNAQHIDSVRNESRMRSYASFLPVSGAWCMT